MSFAARTTFVSEPTTKSYNSGATAMSMMLQVYRAMEKPSKR